MQHRDTALSFYQAAAQVSNRFVRMIKQQTKLAKKKTLPTISSSSSPTTDSTILLNDDGQAVGAALRTVHCGQYFVNDEAPPTGARNRLSHARLRLGHNFKLHLYFGSLLALDFIVERCRRGRRWDEANDHTSAAAQSGQGLGELNSQLTTVGPPCSYNPTCGPPTIASSIA